jgi:hypothetical protein
MDVLGNCDTLSFIRYRRGGVFRRDKRQAKAADALYYLTHPPLGATGPWSEITMKDAIKAIDNFLTTGDSSWKTVRSDLI